VKLPHGACLANSKKSHHSLDWDRFRCTNGGHEWEKRQAGDRTRAIFFKGIDSVTGTDSIVAPGGGMRELVVERETGGSSYRDSASIAVIGDSI